MRPVLSFVAQADFIRDIRHRVADVLADVLLEVRDYVLRLPWLFGVRVEVYGAVSGIVEEPDFFGGGVEGMRQWVAEAEPGGGSVHEGDGEGCAHGVWERAFDG